MFHRLHDGALDHLVVGSQQVVAAHAGLAGKTRRHHHQIRIRRVRVIVRSRDFDVVILDGPRFKHIQCLALRDAFQDINQDDICHLLERHPHSYRCADVA